MSLALPFQAAGERASQALPSVNCSTCHNPVLIIELGTHVCSSPPPPPLAKPTSSQPPSRPSNQRSSTASAASSIGKWLPTRRPSKPELEPPLKPPPSNLFGGSHSGRRGSNSSQLSSSSSNNSNSISSRSPQPLPPNQQYGSTLSQESNPVARPQPTRNQTLPQLSVHNPNPPYSSNSSPHLPRPSISSQHSHNNALPSPPLNPYQLRPSPNDPSPESFQPAASSFHQPTPSYAGSYTTRTPSPIDYTGVKSSLVKTEVGGGAGMAGVGRRAFALATANNQNLYPHSLYAAPISPNGSLSPASSPSSPYPPLPASSSGHGSQLSHASHPSHSSASSHLPPSSASSRPPGPSRQPSATSSNGSSNPDGSERKPQNKLPFLEKYQELVRGSSQSSTKGLGLGAGRSGSSDGGRKSSDGGGGRRSVAVEEDEDDSETELPWAREDVDEKPSSIRSGLLHAVRETSSGSGSSTYSDPQTARNSKAVVPASSSRPVSPPLTPSVQSHSSYNPNGSSTNHNHRASGFRIEEEEGSDGGEDEQPGSRSVASSSSISHSQSRNGKPLSLMTPSTSLDRLTREELTARAVAGGNGKVGGAGGDAFQRTRGGSQGSSGSGSSGASSSSSGLRILGGLKTRLGAEGLEDLVEELELTEEPLPISPNSDDEDDPSLDGPVKKPSASSAYSIPKSKPTSSSSNSNSTPPIVTSSDHLQVTPPAPTTERSRSPSPVSQFHSPSLSHTSSSHSAGGLAIPGSSKKKECMQCGDVVGGSTGRKYVQMKEGAGVMCEKDWKNMYLPKCRRCALPIESQAISSADGQLKGKYHRACFSCYACDKPFEGQTFWVYGSRPYCEHDYHRENNSLCASSTCGKPIEGSCAVLQTNNGEERYHTDCLRCAHPSESCLNSMHEHFDVAGLRFCRTHVSSAWERQQTEARLSGGMGTPRPTKRMTLIVDLPRAR
ncbi:hypothetical protein BDY24DRAFT_391470 [Mrakia frigida]|uniref:uncharacterized protein n=1 Tax=Mrakia frigida TaxID=29902 RepID=UPI003FCC0332